MDKKAYVDIDEVILWIIALLSLVILVVVAFVFRKGGENIIEKLLNLFRYR